MLPISLSIAACLGWGIADFVGGLKSRTVPVTYILTVSGIIGIIILGACILITRRTIPADPAVMWAVPAGISGICAMFMLYRGLAVGTMSVIAPISATGVMLPVIYGICDGERLSVLSLLGIGTAMTGAVLACIEGKKTGQAAALTRGIEFAVGSAVFAGLYFILMDRAGQQYPVWASLIMRMSNMATLLPILLFLKKTTAPVNRRHLPWIIFIGVMDTMAGFAFVLATSGGLLSEVAVISSLYPAVTISLSWGLLKERLARTQTAGVLLAMTGIVLISAF